MRTIVFQQAAAREMDRLPTDVRLQIEAVLDALALEPGNSSSQIKALSGMDYLRLRSGDDRIILAMDQSNIRVAAIGHRRDVYR
jgi:mRNA-degrading endonuclease RelE of RelBE toxin-antitoxin system